MRVLVVVFVFAPDEFVVGLTLWTGAVPRFIEARTATSVASGVLNKASLSRLERPVVVDGVVIVVVVVWSPLAGGAVGLDFSMDIKVQQTDVESPIVGYDVYRLVCHTDCNGLLCLLFIPSFVLGLCVPARSCYPI